MSSRTLNNLHTSPQTTALLGCDGPCDPHGTCSIRRGAPRQHYQPQACRTTAQAGTGTDLAHPLHMALTSVRPKPRPRRRRLLLLLGAVVIAIVMLLSTSQARLLRCVARSLGAAASAPPHRSVPSGWAWPCASWAGRWESGCASPGNVLGRPTLPASPCRA